MYFPIEKRLVDVHHQLGLYHCLLHSAIPRKGLRGAFFTAPLAILAGSVKNRSEGDAPGPRKS